MIGSEGAFVRVVIFITCVPEVIFLVNWENFENKAPIIIEKLHHEHIMPQNKNLSSEWQAALGTDWRERFRKKYLGYNRLEILL